MSGGIDGVFEELDTPPVPPPITRRPMVAEAQGEELPISNRYKLISVSELRDLPRQRWAIRKVAPAAGIMGLYGPSGSGKSFLVIDMITAMATGTEWFGHKIPAPLRVTVVVLEGETGFRNRVEAWEVDGGRIFPDSVRFVFQPFRLNDRSDVLAMASAIDAAGGSDVVIVDTLNRAAPGADENSSRDMGLILECAKELQSEFGGLLVLVHHTGKDAGKGMRGHSSLLAALDAAIEVTRTDDRREWTIAKSKDDIEGQAHGFRLEIVDLAEDEAGELVTSCVVRADDAPATRRPKPPKGGNQKIIYDALGPLFRDSNHFGQAGAPPTRPCIQLEDAIAGTKDRLAVEPKRRAERARLAITGLISANVLGCDQGWIWLA